MDGAASVRAILAVLERRQGLGGRGETPPAWMGARIERVLDALVGEGRRVEDVVRSLPNDDALLERFTDALRVGETSFYRDPPQWEALRAHLPTCASRGRLRALSVGCSTGEEAWTLGMVVREAADGEPALDASVVGMERSRAALETARAGLYPVPTTRQLPRDLRDRFLVDSGSDLRVRDELFRGVRFVERDLRQGPPPGVYEVILCKNVLIYFGEAAGAAVIRSLLGALSDPGLLLVARSEVPRVRALGAEAAELGDGVVAFRAGRA